MKTKTQRIVEILKQSGIQEGNRISKKGFMKILRKIVLEEWNIQGISTLYNYYNMLKYEGIIEEDEEEMVIIRKLEA
jgi:hypothetical protein